MKVTVALTRFILLLCNTLRTTFLHVGDPGSFIPVAAIIKVWPLFTRLKMAHITSISTAISELLPARKGREEHTLSFYACGSEGAHISLGQTVMTTHKGDQAL